MVYIFIDDLETLYYHRDSPEAGTGFIDSLTVTKTPLPAMLPLSPADFERWVGSVGAERRKQSVLRDVVKFLLWLNTLNDANITLGVLMQVNVASRRTLFLPIRSRLRSGACHQSSLRQPFTNLPERFLLAAFNALEGSVGWRRTAVANL